MPVGGLRRGAVARDFIRYHNRLGAAGTDSPGDWANKTLTPFLRREENLSREKVIAGGGIALSARKKVSVRT